MTMTDIQLRRATLEDEQGILDIMKEENLWAGMDYLPFALHSWLIEAEEENTNRENYVLVLGEKKKIVGFKSVHFMRARRSCAMFAFRVSKDIRGKGYGRVIQTMMTDHLLKVNPDLKTAISAIPDRHMTDAEIVNPKHGELLTVKAVHTFKLRCSDLPVGAEKSSLQRLSKESFSDFLHGQSLDHLFESNVIHMNWVPVKLTTKEKEDIEFAARKKQIVLMDDVKNSLSILTLPYPTSGGTTMTIDFFGDDSQLLMQHVREQLRHLKTAETQAIIKDRHQGHDIDDMFLTVVIGVKMTENLEKVAENLGLRRIHEHQVCVTRDHLKMYIYEKNLRDN